MKQSLFYDTIRYDTVIPRDSVIIRYEIVKLPVTRYHFKGITGHYGQDSAEVIIPITQKYYKKRTLKLGYRDIVRFRQFPYILKGILFERKVKRKRWGIGLQAGYGYPYRLVCWCWCYF